jgi:NitT/TauT family transport system permease protein
VNVLAGCRAVEGEQLDLMRSLRASRLQTFFYLKLPSAAPFAFAGVNLAIVYALLGTIVAEFLGAQQGMGVVITKAQSVSDVAGLFAALVVLGVIGMALHFVVNKTEARLIHWTNRKR